jgi:hypothetical protein
MFIAAAVWLASAIFDKTPSVAYHPHMPNVIILANVTKKFSELPKGNNAITAIFGAPLKVSLQTEEVNELIKTGIEGYLKMGGENAKMLQPLELVFSDGIFEGKYALDSDLWTPFGKYINFDIKFVPRILNRNLIIDIKSIKIGKLSIPKGWVNKKLADAIDSAQENENVVDFLNAVTEITIENDRVFIEYLPLEMMKIMVKKAGSNIPFHF